VRAVWLREFGPPSVLVAAEAPEPVAGPGQVMIDVSYANITFVETQFRATGKGAVIGRRFPLQRAADAHAAIESRSTVGKTLLEVN
jgi:NADPH:quinone reductase-like Zn-dependent oxidoreductase